jgi:hypothetical protein
MYQGPAQAQNIRDSLNEAKLDIRVKVIPILCMHLIAEANKRLNCISVSCYETQGTSLVIGAYFILLWEAVKCFWSSDRYRGNSFDSVFSFADISFVITKPT